MRKSENINEKLICGKCTKKATCKYFELVPRENEKDEQDKTSLLDLQKVLHGYYMNSLNLQGEISNNPNEETMAIGNTANAEKNLSKKVKINSINLNDDINDSFQDSQKNRKHSYYIVDNTQKIIDRIPNSAWISSITITQVLLETLDDLINYNGIVYKTMINSFIENKDREKASQLVTNGDIKQNNKRDEIKNDPIVGLIENLEKCRNRKERKRLLVQFNRNVGFGWGEYRKFPKAKNSAEDFDDDFKDNENNESTADSGNTNSEASKTLKKLTYENANKNSNKYNTTVYNEKQLKRIFSDSHKLPNAGRKFTQPINIRNQKIKALENQRKISLLLQSETEDRTYVKIPGKDYQKSLQYLENQGQNSEKFDNLIEDKINEKSINLKNYLEKKQNKADRLIDSSKKMTLMMLENSEARQMLEEDKQTNSKILLKFQRNVKNDFQLEDLSQSAQPGKSIDKALLAQENSRGEIIHSEYSAQSQNSLVTRAKTNQMNKDILVNDIVFKKLDSKDKGKDSNIALFKQENPLTNHTIKTKQEKAKFKKVLNNKHIYKSMNYYKNNDLEYLAYERDQDIFNTLKFRKSIKKDSYNYTKAERLPHDD